MKRLKGESFSYRDWLDMAKNATIYDDYSFERVWHLRTVMRKFDRADLADKLSILIDKWIDDEEERAESVYNRNMLGSFMCD